LDDSATAQRISQQMVLANADIVASSHTCLPALREFEHSNTASHIVINNGSAGMPCFADTQFGIVTRIALRSAAEVGIEALYGAAQQDVFVEAIALEFDYNAWRDEFLSLWPSGSAAHQSYFSRIERGTNFSVQQALGAR
ncbi:MAG: hypothetical protein ACRDAM_16465, partial [Casimicrobium sp.]